MFRSTNLPCDAENLTRFSKLPSRKEGFGCLLRIEFDGKPRGGRDITFGTAIRLLQCSMSRGLEKPEISLNPLKDRVRFSGSEALKHAQVASLFNDSVRHR